MGLAKKVVRFSVVSITALSLIISAAIGMENKTVKADTTIVAEESQAQSETIQSKKILVVPTKTPKINLKGKNLSRGDASALQSAGNNSVVAIAASKIGSPYVWGAEGPNSFDCSGLVYYVFGRLGVTVPRTASDQYYSSVGIKVSKGNLKPGDTVYFNTYGGVSHVGIYIGNGRFIHSPSTGYTVTIANLSEGYYAERYVGAKRFID